MSRYDLAINNGLFFDGTGAPGRLVHLGVSDGRLVTVSDTAIADAGDLFDASGFWVMPGFIDCHTHYDAEIETAPALVESLRHGVTTVTIGNCSIGMALSEPEDASDMFTRVEGIPREQVLPVLRRSKCWDSPTGYARHLDSLSLGPNVCTFLGHSDLRAHVMGLGRAVDTHAQPGAAETGRMLDLLDEALDAGFLGLSVNTLKWDKLDGERFRSSPLPSTFARWRELRALAARLRARERVLQGVPDVANKLNVLLFLIMSAGLFRRKLKTTLITLMDLRYNRLLHRLTGLGSRVFNSLFGADFRWQVIPTPFEMYADGIDFVVFEEFGAGSAARHLTDAAEQRALLNDADYRRWFKRQWSSKFLPRVFHRDFNQAHIVACPDSTVVGRSFAAVARQRGQDVVDTFLDLCAEHGDKVRWFTTIGNDRPASLRSLVSHPDALIGFADSGAHIRNMAFYNYALRLLKLARDAERQGAAFMSLERTVHRLTGELGQWLGIDAGTLEPGCRADLAIVDPDGLDDSLFELSEAPIHGLGGIRRMVNRNDRAVPAVVVNGRVAWRDGALTADVGKARHYGRFLPAAVS